ncbi:MAG TPA: hypothetical protein PKC85_10420 [Bacteroidia bacterium]|jgi:hypothetical protein|nr:hypothetical protein [Bacteroidia bacterium]HMU20244.1 hypothetical protein [Bacteroidia bacterium]
MKRQILLSALVVMTAILLKSLPCNATVWRVNNNPNYTQGCNHCFSSLQVANDTSVVMDGDTIHIEASSIDYVGSGTNETMLSKKLVILGPGYFLNQNPLLQKNAVSATIRKLNLIPGSDYSIIKGVSFYWGSSIYGIEISNVSNIIVESCYFDGGIKFSNSNPISDITLKKCYVTGAIGSTNAANISNLLISNCYFGSNVDLYQAGFSRSGEIAQCVISNNNIDISSSIVFYNNIANINTFNPNNNGTTNIHDNIFIGSLPVWLSGGNNIAMTNATVFPSSGSQDSILNVNPIGICPQCYTAFPGNETFGMFGGADPYSLSGIPNIPVIYQLQCPLNIIQGTPVNVNISTRSND